MIERDDQERLVSAHLDGPTGLLLRAFHLEDGGIRVFRQESRDDAVFVTDQTWDGERRFLLDAQQAKVEDTTDIREVRYLYTDGNSFADAWMYADRVLAEDGSVIFDRMTRIERRQDADGLVERWDEGADGVDVHDYPVGNCCRSACG
jgi:hypothetical protein